MNDQSGIVWPKSSNQRQFNLPFDQVPQEEDERKTPKPSNEEGDGGVQGNDPFSSLAPGAPFIGGKATAPILYDSNPNLPLDDGNLNDDRFQDLLQKLRLQEEEVTETRRVLKEYNPNFDAATEEKLTYAGEGRYKATGNQILQLQSELDRKNVLIQELEEHKRSLTEVTNSLRIEVEECKTHSEQEEYKTNEKQRRIDILEADNSALRQELGSLRLILESIAANKNSLAESTASELERLRRMLRANC